MLELNTTDFQYFKDRKLLQKVYEEQWPDKIEITSAHTGRIIVFQQVSYEVQAGNEFWDGELMEYVPTDATETDVKVRLSRG